MTQITRRELAVVLGAVAVPPAMWMDGCESTEARIVDYCRIAAIAAVSIGTLIKPNNPQLGEQIVNTANAVIVAAAPFDILAAARVKGGFFHAPRPADFDFTRGGCRFVRFSPDTRS